jgi:hypothetical protein
LREVEQPGSDIDHYVDRLAVILENKKNQILTLKKNLDEFKQHLLEEQIISTHCSEMQSQNEMMGDDDYEPEVYRGVVRQDLEDKENSNDFVKPGY